MSIPVDADQLGRALNERWRRYGASRQWPPGWTLRGIVVATRPLPSGNLVIGRVKNPTRSLCSLNRPGEPGQYVRVYALQNFLFGCSSIAVEIPEMPRCYELAISVCVDVIGQQIAISSRYLAKKVHCADAWYIAKPNECFSVT